MVPRRMTRGEGQYPLIHTMGKRVIFGGEGLEFDVMRYTATCTRFMLGGTDVASRAVSFLCNAFASLYDCPRRVISLVNSAVSWRDVAVAKREGKKKEKGSKQ